MAERAIADYATIYLEILEQRALRCERVFRDRLNPFELDDLRFIKLFRLPKAVVIDLIEELKDALPSSRRRHGLPVQTKVLIAIRFFAFGCYQKSVAQDLHLSVSQPTVSRCVNAVSQAIVVKLLNKWVKFPWDREEMLEIKQRFMQQFKFPRVVGVIDCTHVSILAPSSPNHEEHAFVNRKGYHSINVQMICDSQMRITNINARYPGSTHDSFIWKFSGVREKMVSEYDIGNFRNSWLLGDSGYPLEPWLLVPFPNSDRDASHVRFNSALSKARTIVERQFGLIKQVWRCLLKARSLHYSPESAAKIILACAVLHNIFIENKLPTSEFENPKGEVNVDVEIAPAVNPAHRGNNLATQDQEVRRQLIASHFAN